MPDWSKYKTTPSAPATPQGAAAAPDWSTYKVQAPAAAAPAAATKPQGNRFLAGAKWLYNTEKNIAQGVNKGSWDQIQSAGQTVLGITDALGVTKGQSKDTFSTDPNATKPKGNAQGVGDFAAKVAPYFTGAGEAEGAAAGVRVASSLADALGKDAASVVPKISGFVARHAPTVAANTAVGTAQAKGNVGQGFGSALLAEGAGAVAKGAGSLIKGALPSAEKTAASVLDMISPKLTAKEKAAAAASRGTTKSGLLGNVKLNPDAYMKKVADSVRKYVPNFNPSKTFSENLNATKNAVSGMAEKLKADVIASGKDIIFPFKQLASQMASVEKPIAIKADTTLNRQFDLAREAAMKIVQKNGGTVSSLFDSRKEFDQLVEKQFPNLYDKENAPMRAAITSMRNVMNDFIGSQLPDIAFKDSLTAQSHLFTAIDNLSEKAAEEVGTNVLTRAADAVKNHPIVSLGGGVAAYEAAKHVPVVGKLLP